MKRTRFLPIGNPAESGAHILYYFRQENHLGKHLFVNAHELFDPSLEIKDSSGKLAEGGVNRYFFVDDFCGSGEQANQYSKDVVDRVRNLRQDSFVAYHVVFGTNAGIQAVRDHGTFDNVQCLIELDDSFKCFGDQSRYFREPSIYDKAKVRKMVLHYGKKLWGQHPLGHKDSQLMIGFSHNTPNNTLPIFWSDNPAIPWKPLFKRYPKRK